MGDLLGMFPTNLSSLLLNGLVVHLVMSLIALSKQLNSLGPKFVTLSASTDFIQSISTACSTQAAAALTLYGLALCGCTLFYLQS